MDFSSPLFSIYEAINAARDKDDKAWYATIGLADWCYTFSTDNWHNLPLFAATIAAKEKTVSVVLRRFEPKTNPEEKIPWKTICAVLIRDGAAHPLSGEDTLIACTTDHQTGKRIKQEEKTRYVDAESLLPALFIDNFQISGTVH